MKCRAGCGACCIEISISSPIPGMPDGKPAGIKCINLGSDNLCTIHGSADYPEVCKNFSPSMEMCGQTTEHAVNFLRKLEELTN